MPAAEDVAKVMNAALEKAEEKIGPPTPGLIEAAAPVKLPDEKAEEKPADTKPEPPPMIEPEAIETAPHPIVPPHVVDAVEPPKRESVKAKAKSSAKIAVPPPVEGGPLGAYEALAKSARLSDLVSVTKNVVGEAARSRKGGPGFGIKVSAAADDVKLERPDAQTPFGNALEVLGRGPEDAAERALAAALWAHAVAETPRGNADDEDVVAGDVLWLATHTAFDATSLLDRALGDDAAEIWEAVAARVKRIDQGKGGALGRGEAIVGAAALASSNNTRAKALVAELGDQVKDPVLVRMLGAAAEAGPVEVRLEGEIVAAPRGPIATALLAFTGILFVIHALRLLARLALAYRRPAEVMFTDTGVRLKTRTEMLGRTLREKEHVIVKSGLVRVMREVRYPRLAFYAGLLALAFGSYIGVRAFVDGVRAASPSLLLVGLVIVIVGIAADFVLGSLIPGARGKCRIAFVPRSGRTLCIGDVDVKRADDALARTLRAR